MQRRLFLKNTTAAGVVALVTPTGLLQAGTRPTPPVSLADGFLNPPATARAHTWWHWMNGNVTAEGITLDLEAMKAIGLGGFQNFDAGTGIPAGPLVYLSPEWLALKAHAIREADRLGLEFTMHNCPGWSSSGGPWIGPELAMQQVSWSELTLAGGRSITQQLPTPLTRLNYYRDVRVLAFPALPGEEPLVELLASATVGGRPVDVAGLTGAAPGAVLIGSGDGPAGSLLLTFKQPYNSQSLAFLSEPAVPPAATSGGGGAAAAGSLRPGGSGVSVTLEVSDDGRVFRRVAGETLSGAAGETTSQYAFAPVTSRFIRLSTAAPRQVSQLRLSGTPRLADWPKKTNGVFNGNPPAPAPDVPAVGTIDPATLVDLTAKVDTGGVLRWNAPAGNWTVLRIGYTPVGTLNRSAPDTGIGLECDKFNPQAITFHFERMMDRLLPMLKPLAAKGKVGLLVDSYEVGMQNWTAQFPAEFKQRAGYDLATYLPTLTGRVVGSVDITERFLWDFRRVQADLMADHYYGQFTKLCRQHNLIAYAEPYDRGPMEEMQIGSRVDTNMGEFWHGLSTIFQNNQSMRRTTKLAASIAHTNGQRVVGAEAFTAEPDSARWQEYPFGMKAQGDRMFTQGLNRIVFHRYAHQPHPTARPGMTMGPWGIHFDRTATWWPVGSAWLTYIARCQYLLQQGLFVADLAYFTGEAGGVYTRANPDELNPPPPAGYDYDLINAETLLTKATVRGNRLTLPDGMSYRVLVLSDTQTMTLKLARKLRELVGQGLCLMGPKPERTPGLSGGADEQRAFRQVIDDLWGNPADISATGRRVGSGTVFPPGPLAAVLAGLQLQPDVTLTSRSGDAPILTIHRRTEDGTDLYFLTNQRRTTEDLVCLFRTTSGPPELWDAVTGSRTPVAVYDTDGPHTRVPVQLSPYGSVFVAFRKTAAGSRRLVSIERDDKPVLTTTPFPAVSPVTHPTVINDFAVSFWAKPELNVMLDTHNFMDQVAQPWTDFYTIYPPSGEALYGPGHETAGLTVGRNGVAVWQRGAGQPVLTLAAPVAIQGWSHVALVYQDGLPAVYVNGALIQKGKGAGNPVAGNPVAGNPVAGSPVHPGLGPAYLADGASYYNGDMSRPQLLPGRIDEARIKQLASQPVDLSERQTPTVSQDARHGLCFWQNGQYRLRDGAGAVTQLAVTKLPQPVELSGPWRVNFPAGAGAPDQVTLPGLQSLHLHADPGVRHFSGTATYHHTLTLRAARLADNRRQLLDLGQVEVIAEVLINGQNLGILWSRPYRLDITDALKAGTNTVEIRATNLWPNRLIGDAGLPPEASYTPGAGASGFASLSNGAIEQLPDWYKQGKPKPPGGRVTFATWNHYAPTSPLLESGLVGPVVLLAVEHHSV